MEINEMSVNDATHHITINELKDSLAQMAFRPSYDLLYDQLNCEAIMAFKKLEEENNINLPVVLPLWRLIEHQREELCIVRKAMSRTLAYMADIREHENMQKRQKLEKLRNKAKKLALHKQIMEESPIQMENI